MTAGGDGRAMLSGMGDEQDYDQPKLSRRAQVVGAVLFVALMAVVLGSGFVGAEAPDLSWFSTGR